MKPITKKRIQMACEAWDYFILPAREYRKIPHIEDIISDMHKYNERMNGNIMSDFVESQSGFDCFTYDRDSAMALALWSVWEELE